MSLKAVCQHCRKIKIDLSSAENDQIKIEFGRHDYYPGFPALTKSARDGCEICRLFKDEIQANFRRERPRLNSGVLEWDGGFSITFLHFFLENGILNDHVDESVNGPFRLVLDIEAPQIRHYRVCFDVFAEQGSAAAVHGRIQRRLPSLDASSDVSIGLIKGWLRECDEHHDACRQIKPPKLPTRVIDVSGEVPRLVATRGISDEYIALSHCWGDPNICEPPLKTDTRSLEARLQSIDMHELPQNFRDAITLTRNLGFRYIWIDSLCIIQDSPSDWEAEAARMADVYKGSYLTVAATSAVSSHDGFLKRPPRMQQLVKVPYHHKGSDNPDEHFYLCLTDARWAENSFDKYIEQSVWNQRGWTFQERLLPKRVLHFAKDVFCLECRSRDYTEDNRPALASVNRTPWLENDGPRLQSEEVTASSKEDRLYRRWYTLVERYALRDFTYAKDKLPAIVGLAQEMAGFLGDVYMDGLWKRDLSRGLMWDTIDYGHIKLHSNRAPSWSWANFDGHINWTNSLEVDLRSERYTYGFTLLESTIGIETADQVARTCRRIKASGKIMEISAALRRQASEGSERLVLTHDIMLQNVKIGEGALDLKDTSYIKPGLRAFLVYHEIASSPNKTSCRYPSGLLLEMTQTCSNEYRRVGTFTLRPFYSEDAWHDARINLFDHCPTEIFTLV